MTAIRLGCFVMARNEVPILGPFLDQLDELFDDVEFVDHSSTDGSARLVESRAKHRYSVSRLVSAGYPQSEVATMFAHRLLDRGCDYVFLLDCDEFLPFADRTDLEGFLERHSHLDMIRVPWLNVCPTDLSGGDIFTGQFLRANRPSNEFFKIVIRSTLRQKDPHFVVGQGYHNLVSPSAAVLSSPALDSTAIIHVPIQSYAQLAFKLANGSRRLAREKSKLAMNQGGHWVELARLLTQVPTKETDWVSVALNYPHVSDVAHSGVPLEYSFPYVRSPYKYDQALIADQVAGLLPEGEDCVPGDPSSFCVIDSRGEVVAGAAGDRQVAALNDETSTVRANWHAILPLEASSDLVGQLVEPLFALPSKLPHTAWAGHVPFMFVLMKMLRPRSYVELGVHNGASLIAAATAARTYSVDCDLYGVDSWEGDEHAGQYEGDSVYEELNIYASVHFPRIRLIRSYFNEARRKFRDGSVDLLHIDGLHTYDAVREDFESWISTLSTQGVVIFHDINVFESGFGVHRYWSELKDRFTTIEFLHSFGLGVLFMDPSDPRVAPLVALARSDASMAFYRDLVAMVAGVIHERMGYFSGAEIIGWRNKEISALKSELETYERLARDHERATAEASSLHMTLNEVFTSRSWRLTKPLRAMKRRATSP